MGTVLWQYVGCTLIAISAIAQDGALQQQQHGEEDPVDAREDPRLGPYAHAALAGAAATMMEAEDEEMVQRAAGGAGAGAGGVTPSEFGPVHDAAAPASSTRRDNAALLSSKMLQGWALLDKYCPV